MKKLILLPLLFFNYSLAQWTFSETKDPFDGLTKSLIGVGQSGEIPYDTPLIEFRKRNSEIQIFFSKIGNTSCDKLEIIFSYGDPSNLMYFFPKKGMINESVFLRIERTNEIIKISEFLDYLKTNDKGYFRFKSKCYINNFELPLEGLKKHIDKIFDEKFYELVDLAKESRKIILQKIESETLLRKKEEAERRNKEAERRIKQAEQKIKKEKELKIKNEKATVITNKLYQDALDIGLDEVSLKLLRDKLDREEIILNDDLFKYVKLEIGAMDLSSLSEKNNKISLKIVLSNGNAKLLFGSWYLKPKSKVLMEAERLRRLEKEQRDMQKDRYLSKYQNENLSEFLLETIDKIIKKSGNLKWDDIEKVKIKFSNYTKSVDKFYNLTLIVSLKNSRSISEQLRLSLTDLTIRMSDLISMGGEPNKFF